MPAVKIGDLPFNYARNPGKKKAATRKFFRTQMHLLSVPISPDLRFIYDVMQAEGKTGKIDLEGL
jgi:hypothetical protein